MSDIVNRQVLVEVLMPTMLTVDLDTGTVVRAVTLTPNVGHLSQLLDEMNPPSLWVTSLDQRSDVSAEVQARALDIASFTDWPASEWQS